MPDDLSADSHLEIAHVLFIDIVGYSKLLTNDQRERVEELNAIVRSTDQFRSANEAGKLVRLTTGDGMALAFFTRPDAPARCALQIAGQLRNRENLPLRMGIHSGPVSGVTDVNEQSNIAGAGINMAQRVMDCGDAGHILLSKRIADDLAQDGFWHPQLHDLGECEVKHGVRLSLANLYNDEFGNPAVPEKLKTARTAAAAQKRRGTLRAASLGALGLVAAAALIAFLFVRYAPRFLKTAPAISDKSVAVLPLENLSDEKENAYFADGVQDELLSNLAKIKDLKVISRTSVMQYKTGITRNLKEIAHQLGVSNIVEGSVRRSGNHMRVSMQLIDALTDRHLWAQNYDRTVADSVALQGELATQIASEVGATISPQEKARVEATPTKNAAAYDAYLRGRVFAASLTDDNSNWASAAESFKTAVSLDPNFALGWANLSCAHSLVYWSAGDSTPARLAAAKDALDHAVALDPNLPETHLAIGYYRYYGLRDFNGALAEFQVAEKSLPNNVDVLRAIGFIQRRFLHWDEVIAVMRRVIALDPRNLQAANMLGACYMAQHRFPEAMAMSDYILAIDPSREAAAVEFKIFCFWAMRNFEAANQLLARPDIGPHVRGHQALMNRHYAEAAEFFSKALKDAHGEDSWEIRLDLGLAQERAGNTVAAKATFQKGLQEVTTELSKVVQDSGPAASLHSYMGVFYAALGDAGSAIPEGQKGMAMQPSSDDPFEGPEREEQMAQIYALLGKADEAIPIINRLVHTASLVNISVGLMYISPIWDPISNDPRFQELCREK
jgi:serine/threonine-protein kinase